MSDSGADTKSVSQALADFSQKFARFAADPQAVESLKVESPLKTLQDQINERESERVSLLRRQFLEYACPMTSDIEEDEEALIKAYKLYCQLVSIPYLGLGSGACPPVCSRTFCSFALSSSVRYSSRRISLLFSWAAST